MKTDLSINLLRSFVAIADSGSMTRAAEQTFVTQSALSLQMKRLSSLVQAPLFHSYHRGVLLTPAGKTLLTYARAMVELNERAISALEGTSVAGPVRIGMVQDVADALLSGVLVRFAKVLYGAPLQVRINHSTELLNQLSGGLLDAVVCLGSEDDPAAIAKVPMVWLGHSSTWNEETLSLALMEDPCLYRTSAISALEAANRAFTIALVSPSISVLRAAVDSGFAITCRTDALFDKRHVLKDQQQFPLPKVSYCLHTTAAPSRAVERLALLITDAVRRLAASGTNITNPLLGSSEFLFSSGGMDE